MNSILITGVGGGVGQSILKSLSGCGYRLVAADGEMLGTGLYAADRAYHIPYASSPQYVERLLDVAVKEKCALLFPGLDAELPVLAISAARFKAAGVRVIVSSSEVVTISDDKLLTARFLEENGFPYPRTGVLGDVSSSAQAYPVLLKPRRGGARSKGILVARSEEELLAHQAVLTGTEYVVQEQIVGDEFTCGSISFDGRCHGSIVMRRVLRDGDTYKAFVVKDMKLTGFVVDVIERLRPFGACNVQLRVRDGIPYVFEFNARCSGTTYCRTLAGFNEPKMIAEFFLSGTTPKFDIKEISVLRYWKELVVDNSRINEMHTSGQVTGNGSLL